MTCDTINQQPAQIERRVRIIIAANILAVCMRSILKCQRKKQHGTCRTEVNFRLKASLPVGNFTSDGRGLSDKLIFCKATLQQCKTIKSTYRH